MNLLINNIISRTQFMSQSFLDFLLEEVLIIEKRINFEVNTMFV